MVGMEFEEEGAVYNPVGVVAGGGRRWENKEETGWVETSVPRWNLLLASEVF